MGFEFNKRPVKAPNFRSYSTEPPVVDKSRATTTVTSTATILPANGAVILAGSAAADHVFRLPTPVAGGRVHVTATDSTHAEAVRTYTTAQTFFGTTFQTVSWSTAVAYRMASFEVVGPSTNLKWMVVARSTGATLT